ncbi:MAG: hypothetical protein KC620_07695 [Myxococcales bacterium]|nr:hypothetical protein [Myxococcales bacterium]
MQQRRHERGGLKVLASEPMTGGDHALHERQQAAAHRNARIGPPDARRVDKRFIDDRATDDRQPADAHATRETGDEGTIASDDDIRRLGLVGQRQRHSVARARQLDRTEHQLDRERIAIQSEGQIQRPLVEPLETAEEVKIVAHQASGL